jgi:hypothetical protein
MKIKINECFICRKEIKITKTGPTYLMRLQELTIEDGVSRTRADYSIELCRECYMEKIKFFEGSSLHWYSPPSKGKK